MTRFMGKEWRQNNQNTPKQNKMEVLEAAISKTRKHEAAFQLSFPDHHFELGWKNNIKSLLGNNVGLILCAQCNVIKFFYI